MKRKKLETKPIPEAQRNAIFRAMRQLQDNGQAEIDEKQFPVRPCFADGPALLTRQRHGFVMETMLRCGLRFSELARLKRADLSSNGMVQITRSKRGLDGEIMVPSDFAMRLIAWHGRYCSQYQRYSPLLFPSRSGGQLAIKVFNEMLTEFGGLFEALKISSHCFRDTAAVLFIGQRDPNGQRTDIVDAARFLGHNRVSSTEIYISKKEQSAIHLKLDF
jgi:integrase